ncbi:Os08g0367850 [Oryza sativa Japonica Group]|uniref:Os08g0367850 protein n=1 Tax=Oryza sativa subsp. japonica TaxID=39947 RepID=A0A0P0XFX6_ORYSJ|nr:Os08g0367850 [Oryza sativa Japonica Group]
MLHTCTMPPPLYLCLLTKYQKCKYILSTKYNLHIAGLFEHLMTNDQYGFLNNLHIAGLFEHLMTNDQYGLSISEYPLCLR